jgi:dolichol-phosphate mannosyltransferase
MGDERFLVVMPTYDERENIERILPEVLAQDPRLEVLVVDDASPDGTGACVEALAREESRIHLLKRPGKLGLGAAYIAGFRWALERDYAAVFEMDADFSHPPRHLPEFIRTLRDHDAVLGSRYLGGRVTVINWPMSRLLLSYFGTLYARAITRLPFADATGGFNGWRRAVLEDLALDRIESDGYAFQIELKLRAWRRGFRIAELPIVFAERESGESKLSRRIVREAIWKVWKLRFLDLAGRLEP